MNGYDKITGAYLQDPATWSLPPISSKEVTGADMLWFERFEDGGPRYELVAKARGKIFRQKILEDGPLASADRLSLDISSFMWGTCG